MNDSGEKRYDATPTRRDRAKRDGNVPRSSELTACAAFGAGLCGLVFALPWLGALAAAALRGAAARPDAPAAGPMLAIVGAALVPAVCAATAAVGVTLAQSGGVHLVALRVDAKKLAPLPGLKRMVGGEAAVAGARTLLAFVAVAAAVAPIGLQAVATATGAPEAVATAELARDGIMRAGFSACAVGALFAFADLALARRRWLRSLRMSLEELKRDHREHDGDPHTKSRRRRLHRALSAGAVARTRQASFVVVNPTHVAVAIRYAPPAVAVPEILVRAADDAARTVRAIAVAESIPVVENVALARWLFRCGEAGRPIPAETFVAVAHAIAALVRAGLLDA